MDQIHTTVVRDLLKFGAFLQRIGDRVLRPFGISQQEFTVLSAIVREGKPVYQSTIIVDLLVERSNLSKIVKRLETKGLIDVCPTPQDGRVRLLSASPAGIELFQRANRALMRWNKEWMENFSRDDLVSLQGYLSRLNATSA
jgi:DNA-binding MarR family transcriptional regulator